MNGKSRRNEIWVICETKGGTLTDASCELLWKARELAGHAGAAVSALLMSGAVTASAAFAAGADFVRAAPAASTVRTAYETARIVAAAAKETPPLAILLPATVYGRAAAPQVAALLGAGLTADCTGLAMEGDLLVQTRPAFGGNILAEIVGTGSLPQMATVRPKAMPAPVLDYSRTGPVKPLAVPKLDLPLRLLRRVCEAPAQTLTGAQLIVAGGLGAGGREGFAKLSELAGRLGCPLGASRAAVNAGLAPYAAQVGQTGVTVRPKLYLAFGISGAVQHLAGMGASDYIIAVNTDRRAPIFDHADYGVVADSIEVMDLLLKQLES